MDFKIRQAIEQNVRNDSATSFQETIEDAIARGDEHLLPGLGVFLEAWWQQSDTASHQQFTEILAQHFEQH